jgi:hypothetical protein
MTYFTEKNKEYYINSLRRVGQEKILCAAVWYKDLPLKVDIPDNRTPYNITEGVVFCGHRHPHCMWTMVAITGIDSVENKCGYYEQGFLTNCNRFVDRIEAGKIAWKAGQLEKKPYINGRWCEIYSEDLY